jgi:hypothetical protein
MEIRELEGFGKHPQPPLKRGGFYLTPSLLREVI